MIMGKGNGQQKDFSGRERRKREGNWSDQNSFFTFRKLLKNTKTNDNLKMKCNAI